MRPIVCAPLLVCLLAPPLSAQICVPNAPCPPPKEVPQGDHRGHAETLAINAVLGGATSGLLRHLRGGSFSAGFARGAAGGGVVYAGKRIAVGDAYGAGLLGRQVAAVGASEVWNASAGAPVLHRFVFPVGPFRMYTGLGERPHLRVDAAGLALAAAVALRSDTRLDLGASVSAAAPVFRAETLPGDERTAGIHIAGLVLLLEDPGVASGNDRVFAHERVHVLQHDQAFLSWSAEAETRLLAAPRGRWRALRHVDLGLHLIAWSALNAAVAYDARPWEREAYLLAGERKHTEVRVLFDAAP
jgi:hypothetical protein